MNARGVWNTRREEIAVKRVLKVVTVSILSIVVLIGGYVGVNWAPDLPVASLTERWAPAPSRFLDLPVARVHLRDEGRRDDPTPLLLLHGTSASLHTWDGWAADLARDHRVIRVDMPGFGLTGPAADGDYTMQAYVRFVVAVLDALEVPQAIVAGNSLGGAVAWETAVAHPGRVAKLVLVDAGGYPPASTSVPIGFRIARIPALAPVMQRVLPRSMIESSVRNVYGDPSKVTPELVDRYYELTRRAGNRAALGERFRQSPRVDRTEAIRSITQPTLVLWGSEDRLILPENAERFGRDVAHSEVVVFEGLGHVPQEEAPAPTVAAVRRFLEAPAGGLGERGRG